MDKKTFSIKYVVIILLFIVSGIISWKNYFSVYTGHDSVDIKLFPKTINGWTSEDIEITEKEFEILETKNAFIREYTSPTGQNVMLYIIYSEKNRKVSHPPEICYRGSGLSVISKTPDKIKIARQNKELEVFNLLFEKFDEHHVIFYWFKVGDTFTRSYWKQQMLIAVKTLMGKPASSALIRLSTVVENNDIKVSEADIKEFAQLILPYFKQYIP